MMKIYLRIRLGKWEVRNNVTRNSQGLMKESKMCIETPGDNQRSVKRQTHHLVFPLLLLPKLPFEGQSDCLDKREKFPCQGEGTETTTRV